MCFQQLGGILLTDHLLDTSVHVLCSRSSNHTGELIMLSCLPPYTRMELPQTELWCPYSDHLVPVAVRKGEGPVSFAASNSDWLFFFHVFLKGSWFGCVCLTDIWFRDCGCCWCYCVWYQCGNSFQVSVQQGARHTDPWHSFQASRCNNTTYTDHIRRSWEHLPCCKGNIFLSTSTVCPQLSTWERRLSTHIHLL